MPDLPPIPEAILRAKWGGKSRACPKCNAPFVSQYDQGQCTECSHLFNASDIYGIPDDIDIESIIEERRHVSDETSEWIMKCLQEKTKQLPARPEHFDNPRIRDSEEIRHHAGMWDFDMYFMEEAISQGGELWTWSTPSEGWKNKCGMAGFAVVKNDRILAAITTVMT